MVKDAKPVRMPVILRIIQVLNYLAVFFTFVMGLLYLFATDALLVEINGSEFSQRYILAGAYLLTAGLIGYVTYLFRQRRTEAVAYYIVFNFIAFALLALTNHYDNYDSSVVEDVVTYLCEALIVAYLLFSKRVKAYFNK